MKNQHSHLYFALIIIVIFAVIYFIYKPEDSLAPVTPTTPTETVTIKVPTPKEIKTGLFERLASTTPLTKSEKTDIFSVLGGKKGQVYSLSAQEKKLLLSKLNQK